MEPKTGLVAILDALGAARYDRTEIERFLKSRERIVELLREKAHSKEIRGHIAEKAISVFTFNDTVLIVNRTALEPTLQDVQHFCLLLRKFLVDSLVNGVLFRGSLSMGSFYVDEESNTVMGPAVTDAAAWYDAADWIGINATPYATLRIQALHDAGPIDIDHALVDCEVPLKAQPPLRLKAVNWPKGFYVAGVRPQSQTDSARATFVALLLTHGVPKGAEGKHLNTVKFFDHCDKARKAKKK